MKKKSTEQILAESFLEIAGHKNVSKITVNDIVGNCEMSPATFYRHFRDKYDLITWIYEQGCCDIVKRHSGSPHKTEEIVSEWIAYCEENRPFLVNLLKHTSGYGSFFRYMIEKHVRFVESDIISSSGKDALTEKIHLEVCLYSSGLIVLLCAWLRGEIVASQEELAAVIHEAMPKSLRQLFNPAKE